MGICTSLYSSHIEVHEHYLKNFYSIVSTFLKQNLLKEFIKGRDDGDENYL